MYNINTSFDGKNKLLLSVFITRVYNYVSGILLSEKKKRVKIKSEFVYSYGYCIEYTRIINPRKERYRRRKKSTINARECKKKKKKFVT